MSYVLGSQNIDCQIYFLRQIRARARVPVNGNATKINIYSGNIHKALRFNLCTWEILTLDRPS
jgi:hypothetical protein